MFEVMWKGNSKKNANLQYHVRQTRLHQLLQPGTQCRDNAVQHTTLSDRRWISRHGRVLARVQRHAQTGQSIGSATALILALAFGGRNCSDLGSDFEISSCNAQPCPIDGGYGAWSEFEPCSRTCDGGRLVRRRYCINPEPRFGGRNCDHLGNSVNAKTCNTQNCPGECNCS